MEHFIDETEEPRIKDGPIKIEIVGDTSHLFADEDFEKKEVVLLHEFNQTNESTSNDNSSNPETQLTSLPDVGSFNFSDSETKENVTQQKMRGNCLKSNLTLRLNNTVQIINGSRLNQLLSEYKENECFLVLFYVPWCPFSANLAPIYNALPRVFVNLDILAFDVSKSTGYIYLKLTK